MCVVNNFIVDESRFFNFGCCMLLLFVYMYNFENELYDEDYVFVVMDEELRNYMREVN